MNRQENSLCQLTHLDKNYDDKYNFDKYNGLNKIDGFPFTCNLPETYDILVFNCIIYLIDIINDNIKIYTSNDCIKWNELQINICIPKPKTQKIKSIVFENALYIFYDSYYISYDANTFIIKEINYASINFTDRWGTTEKYDVSMTIFRAILDCKKYILFKSYLDFKWYKFDPKNNTFTLISPHKQTFYDWLNTGNNLYINSKDYIYIIGYNGKIVTYNTEGEQQNVLNYKFNYNRYRFSIVYNKNVIYVIGGISTNDENSNLYSSIEYFDLDKPKWKLLNKHMYEPKMNVKAIIYNDYMYITGGYNKNRFIKNIERYNLNKIKVKEHIDLSIFTRDCDTFVYSTIYNNDYKKFISTSSNTLTIWKIKDDETNIIEEKKLIGHEDRVVCVTWHPKNNNECASGSNDCSIIIWNTDNGTIIKKYDDHNEIVRSVHYNSEGVLASGSDDKMVIIFDKQKKILSHNSRVRCVKWNPTATNLLLSGCDDFSITLWNTDDEKKIQIFKGHINFIYSLVWKDENEFASSSGDGNIIIWNKNNIVSTKVLIGHKGTVWSIDWKNNILVSGGNDNKIIKWNTTDYIKNKFTGHTGYVLTVNIDNNNNIISGGADNKIKLWKFT
jgi:WD40 repeat protein